MVVPTLFVGVQAIRTNALERATLEALGQRLARSRTYADVEDAMFNQTQVIWRYLSGDPPAKQEFPLTEQVVDFWLDRWAVGLPAHEGKLVDGVPPIEADIRTVAARVCPLNELRHAMAVVGAGDLDHAIVPRSSDEIGELARAFAQMTERLRQSRSQLVQSEKLASIGQMAAAVAHGLRNPLASLRAAAQLARHRVEAPAAREQLNAIVEQVDRLDLRIAHLLAFSRPAPFHPLRESVRTLVEGALSGFAELLRQRGVELAVNCAAALPEIQVDPMRLEQALTEIVSNALDAMPDGGRLEIATRPEGGEVGANGVVVEIGDSGGGIPPEILPTVCEPFFTTRPEGTGLGLAIAKRYVEEAGGRLEIASAVGRGTTVRIWLPVASGDAAPAPAPPAATSLA